MRSARDKQEVRSRCKSITGLAYSCMSFLPQKTFSFFFSFLYSGNRVPLRCQSGFSTSIGSVPQRRSFPSPSLPMPFFLFFLIGPEEQVENTGKRTRLLRPMYLSFSPPFLMKPSLSSSLLQKNRRKIKRLLPRFPSLLPSHSPPLFFPSLLIVPLPLPFSMISPDSLKKSES